MHNIMAGLPFSDDEKFVGLLPTVPPSIYSTYIFFGHSAICYDTSRELAEVNKIKLPNNVIVVTFGDIGNTNTFELQFLLHELAKTRFDKEMLMDPLLDGDSIKSWINTRLKSQGLAEISLTVSIGVDIPKFFGIPFSYVNEKGTDTLFTSGLYELEIIEKDKWKEIEFPPEKPVPFGELQDKVFTPSPILPSEDKIDQFYKKPENQKGYPLSTWYDSFSNPTYDLILTPEKMFKIASEVPGQWHIFYIPSCRSLLATTEVSGAHTRLVTGLVTGALALERKKEEEASKIYVSERQQTLTKAFLNVLHGGGGRRRKRKVKKTSKRKVLRKRTTRKKR